MSAALRAGEATPGRARLLGDKAGSECKAPRTKSGKPAVAQPRAADKMPRCEKL